MTDPTTGAGSGGLRLAQPEDAHSVEEWEAATAAVLRKSRRLSEDDADSLVWDTLTRTTLDGIPVTPLGTPDDADGSGLRPARMGAWDIRSLVAHPDAKRANEIALVDLEGGVTSLWLGETTDLEAALEGVLLDLAPVVLEGDVATAEALVALAQDRGVTLHPATNLGAGTGGNAEALEQTAHLAKEHGVLGVVVDATVAHDAGASEVQELGYSMAVGAAYLRRLVGAGHSVEEAAGLIEFRYAATDEQFPTIAKLRAARRLWARVLELSGVASGAVEQRQHAVTSRPMLTKYDPYNNMLRGTVAAFAAGVGGADAVTVLPFDSPLGRPDGFGRRIARNINHLLIDESHVAKVADPAGGAYAVERLTADLAAAAWAELGTIEADLDGGQGFGPFDARVAATAATREAEVAQRKRPITGVSEFPNLAEALPEREPDPAASAVRRYGASFEELRDTAPAARVFLATMGPVAQHTARATFASNLLFAGGVGVEVAGPTTDADDLARKYTAFAAGEGGSTVVCLAGSDAAYAEWGQAAAAALRAAGATYVIIAGKPVDYADESAAMGVDALAFLHRVREKLA